MNTFWDMNARNHMKIKYGQVSTSLHWYLEETLGFRGVCYPIKQENCACGREIKSASMDMRCGLLVLAHQEARAPSVFSEKHRIPLIHVAWAWSQRHFVRTSRQAWRVYFSLWMTDMPTLRQRKVMCRLWDSERWCANSETAKGFTMHFLSISKPKPIVSVRRRSLHLSLQSIAGSYKSNRIETSGSLQRGRA